MRTQPPRARGPAWAGRVRFVCAKWWLMHHYGMTTPMAVFLLFLLAGFIASALVALSPKGMGVKSSLLAGSGAACLAGAVALVA